MIKENKIIANEQGIIIQAVHEADCYSWTNLVCAVSDWAKNLGFIDNRGYKLIKERIEPQKRNCRRVKPDAITNTVSGRTLAVKESNSIYTFYEIVNNKFYKICSVEA